MCQKYDILGSFVLLCFCNKEGCRNLNVNDIIILNTMWKFSGLQVKSCNEHLNVGTIYCYHGFVLDIEANYYIIEVKTCPLRITIFVIHLFKLKNPLLQTFI